MPPVERRDLKQRAVVWTTPGYNDQGQAVRGDPVEIPCRWSGKQTFMRGPTGDTIPVDATAAVKIDIAVGAQMWLGELADWLGTGSAHADPDSAVMQVTAFNSATDLRNRVTRRTVGLTRYRDTGEGRAVDTSTT